MVRRQRLSLGRSEVGAGATQVWTGEEALEAYSRWDEAWLSGRSLFVITDRRVARLHGTELEPLRRRSGPVRLYRVPGGEAGKRLSEVERLWRRLLRDGVKRESCLVAFGGGSIGDLGGFVASTLFRGVAFLQLPTTLLAQVDAAIGGKTAIDLPEAKNSVGTFHQPRAVIADPTVLVSLPRREIVSGLAEVIKMGATLDAALFARVERDLERLVGGDRAVLSPLISAAQEVKIGVVQGDPYESDSRRALNFGHTLGHAIEAVLGYKELRHGEAVAYGMLFALGLARLRGLDGAVEGRIASLIRRLPLPPLPQMSAARLLSVMARDKKARREGVVWVLPAGLGAVRIDAGIDPTVVKKELGKFLRRGWKAV